MTTLQAEHTESQRIEICRFFKRNFTLHSVEGGVYIGGLNFTSPSMVLPILFGILDAPGIFTTLAPFLSLLGFAIPSMLVAHKVEKMQRIKPFVMTTGIFQRLPYLFAGIILLKYADTHRTLALAAIFLAPLISGISGGLSYTAWMGLVAKTILPERLCSVWAARMFIQNTIGLVAGGVVFWILREYPGFQGYGILYIITFSILALSYFFFSFIHETDVPPANNGKDINFRENIRSIPSLLKSDADFRKFLSVRFLGNSVILAMAFFSPHALKVTGSPDSIAGTFIWASIIGSYFGTAISSYVGDKYGAKVLLIIARILIALNFILIILAKELWAFYIVFGISGFAFTLGAVSMSTLPIKLTPKDKRATYLAVMGLLNIPFTVLFGFLGGFLYDISGKNITLPATAASVLMIFSVVLVLKLKEPKIS